MAITSDEADYKFEITTASGYHSVEEGILTIDQYGDICKILTGKYVAVEKDKHVSNEAKS
jgi:hypothetical protein